eukprot:SAG22_NODE_738_length_7524_cov_57.525522_2_plen_185_part_00
MRCRAEVTERLVTAAHTKPKPTRVSSHDWREAHARNSASASRRRRPIDSGVGVVHAKHCTAASTHCAARPPAMPKKKINANAPATSIAVASPESDVTDSKEAKMEAIRQAITAAKKDAALAHKGNHTMFERVMDQYGKFRDKFVWIALWFLLGFYLPNTYADQLPEGAAVLLNVGSVFVLWKKL